MSDQTQELAAPKAPAIGKTSKTTWFFLGLMVIILAIIIFMMMRKKKDATPGSESMTSGVPIVTPAG